MQCVGELRRGSEQTQKNQTESSLLERISNLELQKQENKELITQMSNENKRLGSKIESLSKTNREFETVNEIIHKQEKSKIEELNARIEQLQSELGQEKSETKRLKQRNDELFEQTRKGEVEHLDLKGSMEKEIERLQQENISSRDLIEEYKLKVTQVEEDLQQKREEMNQIKTKGNRYHKNYNMLSQMYKANESKIRSLINESEKHQRTLQKHTRTRQLLSEGVLALARELKKQGRPRKFVEELIGEGAEQVELDEVFEFDVPVDTLLDRQLGVNRNIQDIKREFDSKNFEFDERDIAEFEKEIEGASGLDSDMFEETEHVRSPLHRAPLSLSFDETMDFSKKMSSEVLDLEGTPKVEDNGESKEQFRKQMEKEIENKIQSRKSLITGKSSKRGLQKTEDTSTREIEPEPGCEDNPGKGFDGLDELKKLIRARVRPKLDSLETDLFDQNEISYMKKKLDVLEDIPELVEWLLGYSVEKLKKARGEFNALDSEKSKGGLTAELVEHALSKKQLEIQNLLKSFRRRNEEYENMLNTSLEVNNRLHQHKQDRIRQVRDSEKQRFDQKLREFLKKDGSRDKRRQVGKIEKPGFFQLVKESFMFGKPHRRKGSNGNARAKEREEGRLSQSGLQRSRQVADSLRCFEGELDLEMEILADPQKRKIKFQKSSKEFSEEDFSLSKGHERKSSVKLKNISKLRYSNFARNANNEHEKKFEFQKDLKPSWEAGEGHFAGSEMNIKEDILFTPKLDFGKRKSRPSHFSKKSEDFDSSNACFGFINRIGSN